MLTFSPVLAQSFSQDALSQFELFPDTDFDEGDYAQAETNPATHGISLDECAAICEGTKGCLGFTYNEKALACFPKREFGEATPFAGAVSGVRPGVHARPAPANDFSPYLLKGNCGAARTLGSKLTDQVNVEFRAEALEIGTPSKIMVNAPLMAERFPAF